MLSLMMVVHFSFIIMQTIVNPFESRIYSWLYYICDGGMIIIYAILIRIVQLDNAYKDNFYPTTDQINS